MIRVALLVLLAGCFSKPGLAPSDGSSGDDGGDGGACVPSQPSAAGMTLEENASHEWTASMPNGSSMKFANAAASYPMPIEINVGNEQLIAAEGGGCGREQQVGIATYPYYLISGGVNPTDVRPFDRNVIGGSYIEVVSNWRYQHTDACVNGTPHGNGHTTWSFFPDGRIVRNDYVQPVDNIVVGQGTPENGCACINDQSNIVTSYVAIREAMVQDLTAFPDAEGATTLPTMSNDVQDRAGACFLTPQGARVGIRWDPMGSATGPRETRMRYFVDEYAFVNDMAPAGSEPTLESTDSYGLRTHMFLDTTGPSGRCTAVNTKLLSHAMMAPVRLGDDLVSVHANGFFDDGDPSNPGHLRERTSAVTLTAELDRLEPGFALRIRFPGFRSITTDVPSTWQHEDDDTFYIFFPQGRNQDDQIVITPECRT